MLVLVLKPSEVPRHARITLVSGWPDLGSVADAVSGDVTRGAVYTLFAGLLVLALFRLLPVFGLAAVRVRGHGPGSLYHVRWVPCIRIAGWVNIIVIWVRVLGLEKRKGAVVTVDFTKMSVPMVELLSAADPRAMLVVCGRRPGPGSIAGVVSVVAIGHAPALAVHVSRRWW